ncbi:MAG: hypothetical protein IPP07_31230 [Holophagales bacterium]|jgi:hypothetical protein|nr:hypothetical protein [Holophagales bacterium]
MRSWLAIGALLATPAFSQGAPDAIGSIASPRHSGVVIRDVVRNANCAGAVTIYDTTHASTSGAEITSTTNGAATSMADKIVLGGTARFACEVQVELFSLVSTAPFDLTLSMFTDCTSSGAAASACGTGPGTLIPGSTATLTNVTPPATLGVVFTVTFSYPTPVDLSAEADNTISVALNASRNDVYWRINETPAVGAIPAGEPATSFVERCGSTAANNGCSRNFGVNNNFALLVRAETTPVGLETFSVE